MHSLSTRLIVAALLLVPLSHAQENCDQHGLDIVRQANGQLKVRWNAAAGTVQLMRASSLDAGAAWSAVSGATAVGGGWWERTVNATGAKGFFRLESTVAPVSAPANVRLSLDEGSFRLEWDSACEASGYIVYVGLTENVGPGDFLQRLVLPQSNSLLIEGLTSGVRYYITMVHVNHAGTGPAAATQSAVFGPNGTVAGTLVKSALRENGTRFEVAAEDAVLALQRVVTPPAPAWPPYGRIADLRGQVSVPRVPVGSYRMAWTDNGAIGLKPDPVLVKEDGLAFGVLDITPAANGSTLFGTALFPNGGVPRVDIEAHDIHLRGTVTATRTGAAALTVKTDYRGRWIFPNIPAARFPVSLQASFAGLTTNTVVVNTPPAANNIIALTFPQVLPTVRRVRTLQNGSEVSALRAGLVTLEADIANPSGLPLALRWTAEIDGETLTATGTTATFTIPSRQTPRGGGQSQPGRGSQASFRVSPALGADDLMQIERAVDFSITGCYSGRVGVLNSNGSITAAHPATVSIYHTNSLAPQTVVQTTADFGGYFETNNDPNDSGPYRVKIEKPGHATFFWSFGHRLPQEAQFCLVPTEVLQGTMPASGQEVVNHAASGTRLIFPYSSLQVPAGIGYHTGAFQVEFAWMNLNSRSPLPPALSVINSSNDSETPEPLAAVWLRVTNAAGEELPIRSGGGATIGFQPTPAMGSAPFECNVQTTTSGSFQIRSTTAGAGSRYFATLSGSTLHVLSHNHPQIKLNILADRTLNYPFDVLVGTSIFPVTVRGPGDTNLEDIFIPETVPVRLQVLDLRQAPGMHFADPANATLPLEPHRKRTIYNKVITAASPPFPQPAITEWDETVSLTHNVAELAPELPAISAADQFLTRISNTRAESNDYYAKINAPDTLDEWLALNGLPEQLGAPLDLPPNQFVLAWDYSTAFYYNLGDLGFARAQTMRQRTGSDGRKDVAFAVTNYRSLEDARCGRGAVATVCMDYALRTDRGETSPARYTRFYVYGGDNQRLIDGVNFDGSGKKFIPGSCIICHGGDRYESGGTANLKARFLPFDVESYTFHPGFGVQETQLAYMNNAVLNTNVTPAIRDLIEGWYGGPPLNNTSGFDKDFVPAVTNRSWAGVTESLTYNNVFKHSCRVCHVSRKDTGTQINSYTAFFDILYGHSSVCGALQMPHAQRTWGVFWGSKAASRLGSAVDQPSFLNNLYNAHPNRAGQPAVTCP